MEQERLCLPPDNSSLKEPQAVSRKFAEATSNTRTCINYIKLLHEAEENSCSRPDMRTRVSMRGSRIHRARVFSTWRPSMNTQFVIVRRSTRFLRRTQMSLFDETVFAKNLFYYVVPVARLFGRLCVLAIPRPLPLQAPHAPLLGVTLPNVRSIERITERRATITTRSGTTTHPAHRRPAKFTLRSLRRTSVRTGTRVSRVAFPLCTFVYHRRHRRSLLHEARGTDGTAGRINSSFRGDTGQSVTLPGATAAAAAAAAADRPANGPDQRRRRIS